MIRPGARTQHGLRWEQLKGAGLQTWAQAYARVADMEEQALQTGAHMGGHSGTGSNTRSQGMPRTHSREHRLKHDHWPKTHSLGHRLKHVVWSTGSNTTGSITCLGQDRQLAQAQTHRFRRELEQALTHRFRQELAQAQQRGGGEQRSQNWGRLEAIHCVL
jgi:hypothetical protein